MLRAVLCLLLVVHADAVRDSFQWFLFKECREVMTESGWVRGCAKDNEKHIGFLGVPYAAPTSGLDRFKDPTPALSWNGIHDADNVVKCPQNGEGYEDCLAVNIFTPVEEYDHLLPVLVYFHDGTFFTGQGQVDGVAELIKQEILLVTINYRLGVFGYLCLGIAEAPGNAGLKDQVAALKWIQRNIASFGGDPDKVTIYGTDAGGVSVELLILSSITKGLFHQAIVESASATSVYALNFDPVTTAIQFAKRLKLPRGNYSLPVLTAFFRRYSPRTLSKKNYDFANQLFDGTFGFAPCVENPYLNTTEPLFVEAPYEILTKGNYTQVPMMFLYTTLEGMYLRNIDIYKEKFQTGKWNLGNFLPIDLELDTNEIRNAISQNVVEFYYGKVEAIENSKMESLKYFGDYIVLHGLLNSAEMHSRNNNTVYLMEFAYRGKMGNNDTKYENITVAGHGDIIKHVILEKPVQNKRDELAVSRVINIITNFVKYGNPIPSRDNLFPILWPRVHPGNVSCLYFDEELKVVDEPHWDRKSFWDNLYAKYRRKPVEFSALAKVRTFIIGDVP